MKSSSTVALLMAALTVTQAAPTPGSPWATQAPWSEPSWPHHWPTPTWARSCYPPAPTSTVSGSASGSASGSGSVSGSGYASSASATATSSVLSSVISSSSSSGSTTSSGSAAPSATIKNGTVVGVYNPEYNQDFFLGVPYAQPPLGDLRFRIPQSINATFDGGVYSATKFSDECVGVCMMSLSTANSADHFKTVRQ